jgi:hypothetical protein
MTVQNRAFTYRHERAAAVLPVKQNNSPTKMLGLTLQQRLQHRIPLDSSSYEHQAAVRSCRNIDVSVCILYVHVCTPSTMANRAGL